jgi:hypothetical protein
LHNEDIDTTNNTAESINRKFNQNVTNGKRNVVKVLKLFWEFKREQLEQKSDMFKNGLNKRRHHTTEKFNEIFQLVTYFDTLSDKEKTVELINCLKYLGDPFDNA